MGGYLAKLSDDELKELLGFLDSKDLVWGAAGLPVEFRRDEAKFEADLKRLPEIALGLQRAGVTRIGTWLMPAHDELTYRSNFEQHTRRLRAVAKVLDEYGLVLGLEYVGPRTLWASKRYSFVHTLAETQELIDAIGNGNLGVVLDSWHWYTAEETLDDLRTLSADQIVAVDLNDAPVGIPVDEQIDNRRTLPAATGVIDVATFLKFLVEIGYEGPVRAEPFSQEVNAMDDEPAVKATGTAMQNAFAKLG
jgi:sugar phosphate isomerase/epimerase